MGLAIQEATKRKIPNWKAI